MLQMPSASHKAISVLYLFAGKPRQGDMTQCLQQQALGYQLRITCVDIQCRPSVNLANTVERQNLLARIRAQEFDAILLSPPCSTFSRAPWANFKGPQSVRSATKPRGLDKLTAAERHRCILGNIFADFTWEVVELAIEVHISFLLLEQPEDLGVLARGPYKGQRPASMWQWPAMAKLATPPNVTTLALHQSSFGTDYPKPTRLLLLGAHHLPDFCYVGPPTYDKDGSYTGPLPRLQHRSSMRNRATNGPFKTAGTEQWPVRMCQWIAAMLIQACSAAAEKLKFRQSSCGVTRRATQPANRRDTGYKVERDYLGRVRHWQATKTSTTVEGYAHRTSGGEKRRVS